MFDGVLNTAMLTAATIADATNLIVFGASILNLFTLMNKDQGKIITGFKVKGFSSEYH